MNRQLTDNERTQLRAFQEEWLLGIACSTAPSNRHAAETGILEAYNAAGLKPPQFIWVRSPNYAMLYVPGTDCEKPRPEIGRAVWPELFERVFTKAAQEIVSEIGHGLWHEIQAEFQWTLLDDIRKTLNFEHSDLLRSHGCHGADYLGPYDYCQKVLGIEAVAGLRGIIKAARNTSWWWPFTTGCVVMERPTSLRHDGVHLHCPDGPAVEFPDREVYHAWHGMVVPQEMIQDSNLQTSRAIMERFTGETRACALERYHQNRFVDPF